MSLSQEVLGRRLAHARETAGLTQVQVGQYLKMPREYVSYVEHGRRPIQIPVLQQLADLYGIHMGQLFEDPADDTYEPALSVVAAFRSPDMSEHALAKLGWLKRFAMNLDDLNRLLAKDGG